MSTYLIGDIQGCYDALQRLLEKIHFDPVTDRLWSCGDLVNRGGQSLAVLRLVKDMGSAASVTMGNHDLHLLAAAEKYPDGGCDNPEFEHILQAGDRQQLLGWLRQQPLAAYSRSHRLLRVHAGVVPQWNCQQTLAYADEINQIINSDRRPAFFKRMYGNQPSRWHEGRRGWGRLRLITGILTRTRFCNADGKVAFRHTGPPGSQPAGYRPWYRHRHRQTRDVVVAFGHWAALGLRIKKRYLALDSGCVWGGPLSAVRLEDRALFQVPGLQK